MGEKNPNVEENEWHALGCASDLTHLTFCALWDSSTAKTAVWSLCCNNTSSSCHWWHPWHEGGVILDLFTEILADHGEIANVHLTLQHKSQCWSYDIRQNTDSYTIVLCAIHSQEQVLFDRTSYYFLFSFLFWQVVKWGISVDYKWLLMNTVSNNCKKRIN